MPTLYTSTLPYLHACQRSHVIGEHIAVYDVNYSPVRITLLGTSMKKCVCEVLMTNEWPMDHRPNVCTYHMVTIHTGASTLKACPSSISMQGLQP